MKILPIRVFWEFGNNVFQLIRRYDSVRSESAGWFRPIYQNVFFNVIPNEHIGPLILRRHFIIWPPKWPTFNQVVESPECSNMTFSNVVHCDDPFVTCHPPEHAHSQHQQREKAGEDNCQKFQSAHSWNTVMERSMALAKIPVSVRFLTRPIEGTGFKRHEQCTCVSRPGFCEIDFCTVGLPCH